MTKTYPAQPVLYEGIQFRSRLESRWAALFDVLRVRYEYEPPLDQVRGWIPDFLIHLDVPVLVECKPIVDPREFLAPIHKIMRSGWTGGAMIVGPSLVLADEDGFPDVLARGTAHVSRKASARTWHPIGRLNWPTVWGLCPFGDHADLWMAWREAANRVQWRSPVV